MAYRVFVSHSMAPADLPIVYGIAQHLAQRGIEPYIAERDWKFGASLRHKVEGAIDTSSCVLAFLTVGGTASAYVNMEIGYARGKGKLVVPVLEKGLSLKGLQVGDEYIQLERGNAAPVRPDNWQLPVRPEGR